MATKRATKKKAPVVEETVSAEELEGAEVALAAESPEALDEALAELEIDEAKAEAYASAPVEETSAKAAPKAAPKSGGTSTPRVSLSGAPASEVIAATVSHEFFRLLSSEPNDESVLKARMADTLEAIDGLDKKTREKAVNLFQSLQRGKQPSVYTIQALKALREAGSMTLKELVDRYLRNGYQPGTARRQAGEMFALFPVVAIGTREPGRGAPMTFNKESVIAQRIEDIVNPTVS